MATSDKERAETLRRVTAADAHRAFAVAQAEAVVARERERLGRSSSAHRRNDPVDARPTLKQHLWELERGKPPEPRAPDAAEVARAKVVQDLTTRIVQVGERLVAQPREKAALEAERERLTAQLHALEGRA